MSVKVSSDVWRFFRGSGNELIVMLALADNADEEHRQAWPSTKYLAVKTRLSQLTVKRILTRLEERGDITIVRRPGKVSYYTVSVWQDCEDQLRRVAKSSIDEIPVSSPIPSTVTELRYPESSEEPSDPPEGGELALARSAGPLVKEAIDTLTAAGVKIVGKGYAAKLGGITKRLLKDYDFEIVQAATIHAMQKGRGPESIPNLCVEIQRTSVPQRVRRYGYGLTAEEILERARAM